MVFGSLSEVSVKMDGEGILSPKPDYDKAKSNRVQIIAPQKINTNMPDFLENMIREKLEHIDDEIRTHEEAIKELNKQYTTLVNFWMRYNPFETGNLSQDVSMDIKKSPGAAAPGGEEAHEENIADSSK